jgi:hypothetical protein
MAKRLPAKKPRTVVQITQRTGDRAATLLAASRRDESTPPRKRGAAVEQLDLVPLSDEELETAKRELPVLLKDLEEMEAEHAKVAKEQRGARKTLTRKIKNLAQQIRQRGR